MKNRYLMTSLLALASAALLAGATPRYGVQGALALPEGDLSDTSSAGIQVGGHALWDFGRGHGIMGRADLTLYSQHHDESNTSLGVGADYTYHVEGRRHGFYLLGGLSLMDYHWSSLDDRSHTDTSLGPDLGVGYDLDRNFGVQARYTFHTGAESSDLNSLNLGVTYTF